MQSLLLAAIIATALLSFGMLLFAAEVMRLNARLRDTRKVAESWEATYRDWRQVAEDWELIAARFQAVAAQYEADAKVAAGE